MFIVHIRPDTWLCKTFSGGWMPTYVRENAYGFPCANKAKEAALGYCQGYAQFVIEEVVE